MSWFKRLGLAAAVTVLAGCGFQPMYGQRTAAPAVTADLSSVTINPIEDRLGQEIRNRLQDRLAPGKDGTPIRYVLDVKLEQNTQEQAFRRDDTATRARLATRAYMTLRDGEKAVFTDVTRSVVSYNISEARFASIMSERDAQARAAEDLANEIQTRLALYFQRLRDGVTTQPSPQSAPTGLSTSPPSLRSPESATP